MLLKREQSRKFPFPGDFISSLKNHVGKEKSFLIPQPSFRQNVLPASKLRRLRVETAKNGSWFLNFTLVLIH